MKTIKYHYRAVYATLFGLALAAWPGDAARAGALQLLKTAGTVTVLNGAGNQAQSAKPGDSYDLPVAQPKAPEQAGVKDKEETPAAATPVVTLKVKRVEGDVTVRDSGANDYVAAKATSTHAAGAAWRTRADSYVDLELSPRNDIRILPRSEIVHLKTAAHPELTALRLLEGTVDVKLDDFKKGQRFEARTPMNTCAAVGTAFRVTYEANAQGTMRQSVECFEGTVPMTGDYISILDAGLKPGQRLQVNVKDGADSRVVTVSFFGQPGETIRLRLWGNDFSITVPGGQGAGTGDAPGQIVLKMPLDTPSPRPDAAAPPKNPPPPGTSGNYVPPPVIDVPQSPAGL